MKTVCAWCGVVIQDGPGPDVSHGCCDACHARLMADIAAAQKKSRRSLRQEIKLFIEFMTGRHLVVRERIVL